MVQAPPQPKTDEWGQPIFDPTLRLDKPAPKPSPKPAPKASKPAAQKAIERRVKDAVSGVSHQSRRRTKTKTVTDEWIEIGVISASVVVLGVAPFVVKGAMTVQQSWNQIMSSPAAKWLGLGGNLEGDAMGGNATGVAFNPLKIESPYLIDDSPPGSYDFTLVDPETDSVHVPVPAPCQGQITEAGDRGGYGYAMALLCDDGTELFMAHFAELKVKKGDGVSRGQALGIQGTTGNSTGEHVHLEVTLPSKAMNDRSVTLPYVKEVLFPFWESGQAAAGFSVEAYKAWISNQESGSNYNAINPDSGALGKYQFMPDTMRSTALKCDGVAYQPTNEEFLRTPDLQEKVMDCYLGRALTTIQKKTDDPTLQCRMMASYHYSGNPDLYDNGNPQSYGGNAYPSIAEYTSSVCQEIL